ncbi:MAG: hypothetical protein ACOYK1_03885 [Vampirovibrionia bacterium]
MEQSLEIKNLQAQLAKAERQSKSDRAFINKLIAQKKELEMKLSLLFTELSKYEGVRGLRLQLKQITKMLTLLNKVK